MILIIAITIKLIRAPANHTLSKDSYKSSVSFFISAILSSEQTRSFVKQSNTNRKYEDVCANLTAQIPVTKSATVRKTKHQTKKNTKWGRK
jgi:hypothetical protein